MSSKVDGTSKRIEIPHFSWECEWYVNIEVWSGDFIWVSSSVDGSECIDNHDLGSEGGEGTRRVLWSRRIFGSRSP